MNNAGTLDVVMACINTYPYILLYVDNSDTVSHGIQDLNENCSLCALFSSEQAKKSVNKF